MAAPSTTLVFALLALAGLYLLFWTWYGGRGKPLTPREVDGYIEELGRRARSHHDAAQTQAERLISVTPFIPKSSASSRAARTCARPATACATAPARARRKTKTWLSAIWVFAAC